MAQNSFNVHHIGGRNGSRGFPVVPCIERDISTVFYEASEDGNEQIISQARRNRMQNVILVNACVGKFGDTKKFYLNRDPFMSSTFSANPEFLDYYNDLLSYDNLISQILEPVDVSEITVQSLDQLVREHGLPECDFLSIDVQGGELDVLLGAVESLKNTVGVVVEVEFAELYKDQPLFSEIQKFMNENGYLFIRFLGLQEWAPSGTPIAGRGEKMHFAADALYLKKSDRVNADKVEKLLFASLAFGQTEYAASVKKDFVSLNLGDSGSQWGLFVAQFFKLLDSLENKRPTFNDHYSVEESFGRFVDGYRPNRRKNFLVQSIFELWRLIPVQFRAKIRFQLKKSQQILKWCSSKLSSYSDIEKLFVEVGLEKIARTLKRSRLR
jgi:FkbM family methyltransferase